MRRLGNVGGRLIAASGLDLVVDGNVIVAPVSERGPARLEPTRVQPGIAPVVVSRPRCCGGDTSCPESNLEAPGEASPRAR
jgi:hypothetical protein